jgi:hypothetical protein
VGRGVTEPNRAQRRAWPKRRQWADRIATDRRLTSGCKAWLALLARRSDDAGKPVWGNQQRMGDQIGRCARSVRRYRAEAEQLGYIQVFRSEPHRGPDGRWTRRKSNAYYLCLPAAQTATRPAPRRTQRAPYCVIKVSRSRRVHLPDSHDRSTPLRGASTATHPPGDTQREPDHPEKPPDPASARIFFAQMRADLAKHHTKPSRPAH